MLNGKKERSTQGFAFFIDLKIGWP